MKQRILYIHWLVAALMLSTLPAMAEVRDTVDFDFVERTFEHITVDGETFIRYSFPDCDQIDQTGAPMLPVKYIRLSVPYNATNITVRPLASWTPANENKRIYPAPVPIPTDGSVTEEPGTVIDSTIYMTDAYWPPSAAELVGDGYYMGENRIVTIAVYPMLYNPVQNKMHNYTQVRVKVSYDLGPTPAGMLVRYNPQLRQQERQQAMALVSNPELVEAHAIPASTVQHMMQQNPDTTNWPVPGYEYMVITTRELAPAFKRLIALKQQKGYRAGVVCVEDIVNDPLVQNGDKCMLPDSTYSYINDDAGKIRQYLRENYCYGTKYVLFAGESVPFRYGYHANKSGIYYEIPTDWYYTDKDTNWSVDGDDKYGEKELLGSICFDTNEDFYVGRIQPRKKEEIQNYTNKLFTYELNPGNGNLSYLQNVLLTEGFRFKKVTNLSSTYSSIFSNITIMEQPTLLTRFPLGEDIVDTLNTKSYSLISIAGHGSPRGICTSGKSSNRSDIYSGMMAIHQYRTKIDSGAFDEVKNKYTPGVLYSYACITTPFDFVPYYYNGYDTIVNVGQSYTLGKDYGGVAFIGNTRNGYTSYSSDQELHFAQEITSGTQKIGAAYTKSNTIESDIYFPMVRNLIGDPEFNIWTDIPHHYDNISITRTDNSISIDGLGNDSLFIVGVSDGKNQHMKLTDTGNLVLSDVNPNSTVMLYNHNYLPLIAPLYLQNERIERSQYIIANDVVAGRAIDSNRTAGNLVIAAGSEYEVDAKGQVLLAPGFTVEKGAMFSVTRSDY